MTFRHRHRLCLFLLVFAAAGCGKDEEKKAATQVAAKVNSTEITVSQVSNVLARSPGIAPEAAPAAKRAILDRLIAQELARQQAIDRKLDRNPNVMQAMESARTEILARAYSEQIAAEQPKPTEDEVKRYYVEHPELFAQRRIFNIEQIDVAPAAGIGAELADKAAKARSMQEVGDWLQSRDIKFGGSRGVRAAEELPLEILPKVHAMKDGETRALETAAGIWQVVRVVASQPAPVDEATATPRIRQYLSRKRAADVMAQEMKRVKEGAKIEYLGEFAEGAAAADAKAAAQAQSKAKALAEVKAKEEAEARIRAEASAKARKEAETVARLDAEAKARAAPAKAAPLPQQTIEKGLGGLR